MAVVNFQSVEGTTSGAASIDILDLGPLNRAAMAFVSVSQTTQTDPDVHDAFVCMGQLKITCADTSPAPSVTNTFIHSPAGGGPSGGWVLDGSNLTLRLTGVAAQDFAWRVVVWDWETG